MKSFQFLFATCVVSLAVGCKNAVYYAQSDRVAIAIEQKPDVAQPVSFSLGFKQRVVAIVPPQDAGDVADVDVASEAASVITRFDFDYEDGDLLNNPTLVQSALITGKAAASLRQNEAEAAYVALSSASVSVRSFAFTNYAQARRWMQNIAEDSQTSDAERSAANVYLAAAEADALRVSVALRPFQSKRWEGGALVEGGLYPPEGESKPTNTTAFDYMARWRGKLQRTLEAFTEWAKVNEVDLDQLPPALAAGATDAERLKDARWTQAREIARDLQALDAKLGSAPALIELNSAISVKLRTGVLPNPK
jgi:hypothetical protein